MKKIAKFITASIVILICSSLKNNIIQKPFSNSKVDRLKNETTLKLSDDFYLEILPGIELLSGVLSQTSWYDKYYKPNVCDSNQIYYQNLKQFFSKYKNHETVQLLEELIKAGFAYNAPPSFMTFLSYPGFDIRYEYTDVLIERAKSKENLEKFRLSLKKLAKESDFTAFYKNNINTYTHLLDNFSKDIKPESIVSWHNNFFGYSGNEFHVVLMPGMYIWSYGNRISTKDKLIIFSMLASKGNCKNQPEKDYKFVVVHEFGHSKIDLHVAALDKLIKEYKIDTLYYPVANKIKRQGYLAYQPFFCETINNAITLLAMKEIYNYDSSVIAARKDSFMNDGQYLLDFTMKKLDNYLNNRDKYKKFDDFLPVLFKEYSIHKDSLLGLAK
jgi:hypothetical protein